MRISVVIALLATLLLVGCGGSDSDDAVDRPSSRYSSVYLAACEAAADASAGDKARATASFEDAHSGLHDLAAAAAASDRAVAARLLEAKQGVEAAAEDDVYTNLLRAVEDAIGAVGDEVGKCPE